MRRLAVLALVPAALSAAILAGCSGTTSGGNGSASASPSGPDANTRSVCAAVDKAISDGAAAFGNDLGNLVGQEANNNKAGAQQARTSALRQLKALVDNVRTAAQPAVDPALVTAAKQVGDNLAAIANDPKLLDKVHTGTDLAPVIERVTRATDPLASVCN